MGDVVDLVLVQADRAHQVDLDLVAGGDTADQLGAAAAGLLRRRQDRRNVVAGMAVLGSEEGVVIIELAHGGAVRPGRPLRMHPHVRTAAEHRRAAGARMRQRLGAGGNPRMAVDRGDGDGGVVDHPVDDHLGNCRLDLDRVGRDGGDLPGELVGARQAVALGMHPNLMVDHRQSSSPATAGLAPRRRREKKGQGLCPWTHQRRSL